MSTKYDRLSTFLSNRADQSAWTATFEQIEDILGFPLPNSAYDHQAWWSNQMRAQSLSWQLAGYKTVDLDLTKREVRFVYVGDQPEKAPEVADANLVSGPADLSIAEAKAGLAARFGVSEDQIEIVIKA